MGRCVAVRGLHSTGRAPLSQIMFGGCDGVLFGGAGPAAHGVSTGTGRVVVAFGRPARIVGVWSGRVPGPQGENERDCHFLVRLSELTLTRLRTRVGAFAGWRALPPPRSCPSSGPPQAA